MSDYAIDGLCHNANRGTYGHECNKPAAWTGESRTGFRSGFCDRCRIEGDEARAMGSWQPFNQGREIAIAINRNHMDEFGHVDEGAMTKIFERYIPLDHELHRSIWRALTNRE